MSFIVMIIRLKERREEIKHDVKSTEWYRQRRT